MGARHYENIVNRPFWKPWVKKHLTSDELEQEAVNAANAYIKEKGFAKLPHYEQAFIRAMVSYGFRNGFTSRGLSAAEA
jgi:hypothetical protein